MVLFVGTAADLLAGAIVDLVGGVAALVGGVAGRCGGVCDLAKDAVGGSPRGGVCCLGSAAVGGLAGCPTADAVDTPPWGLLEGVATPAGVGEGRTVLAGGLAALAWVGGGLAFTGLPKESVTRVTWIFRIKYQKNIVSIMNKKMP